MLDLNRRKSVSRRQYAVDGTSAVRPTLLYISSEAVIPAKAGIQIENTGFRVKPGMTIKVKGLLTQYTSNFFCFLPPAFCLLLTGKKGEKIWQMEKNGC